MITGNPSPEIMVSGSNLLKNIWKRIGSGELTSNGTAKGHWHEVRVRAAKDISEIDYKVIKR